MVTRFRYLRYRGHGETTFRQNHREKYNMGV